MSAAAPGTNPTLSRRRKWAFRLGSSLLVPLLVLAVLEAVLRLAGFGYPTNFFLKTRINGRAVYVENDKFGLRFFPPALARSPSPLVMPAGKTNHTYRLFILGESAALGDPEPAFGFGRFLQVLLNERFPGTRFEVVCTAMTAINSHVILPIARDCARREGDVWIIYMGNNEFVGPFGAGTVFGPQAPRLGFVRFALALKATKIGQLLDALLRSFGAESSRQPSWGGMKMFLDHQVGPDDPRKQRVYEHFQRNLEDILRVAEPAGVKVVLSTVASNLKDCAPFASRHSSGLRGSRLADWQKFYDGGVEAELAGDFAKAIRSHAAILSWRGTWTRCRFAPIRASTESSKRPRSSTPGAVFIWRTCQRWRRRARKESPGMSFSSSTSISTSRAITSWGEPWLIRCCGCCRNRLLTRRRGSGRHLKCARAVWR
ncbi:MAG: hypothetical protein DME22_16330 [Verrucomicrobia bacterium]|nr:MAG: hypothetical protein DME22_16330 [Verrucomicrobiota bacterium]